MNIVYASDDKYSMIVGTSIESLYTTNAMIADLNVYILAIGMNDDNKNRLLKIADRHGRRMDFVDVTEESLFSNQVAIDVQRWSIAGFARLYTPDLLPDLHRILYLDCDTIINDSLLDLWETNIGEYSCAAVSEPLSKGNKRNVGRKATDIYYNSGVMLIDLDKWRSMNAKKLFEECIVRHKGHVPYIDQGVLNEVFNEQIHMLPAKYNVHTEYFEFSYGEVERYRADRISYSKEEIAAAVASPVITHFVSSFLTARPWIIGSEHPSTDRWLAYRANTPWKDVPLWDNTPDKPKAALKWVFNHSPRALGIWAARMLNSVIRPMLDK